MNWQRVWTADNWERLLVGDLFNTGEMGGLLVTLAISLSSIVLSTLLGALIGLARSSQSRTLSVPAMLYIQGFRNVPLLILVFWAYFLPPAFGLEISKFLSVLLALTLFTAAYIAEIVRGGIRSVSDGHIEAARALGLGPMQIRTWIVLPQAFFNMLPALSGRYVVAVKNTSLAFLIGLADLTEIGKQIGARLMTAPMEVYLTLLLIYFVVNRGISSLLRRLEDRRRFNRVFLRI
ncbi:MAG: amino acid ABC transporter permease [Hyphomicrobiaceae bacterium]|nr:amino acid ABC transporter permease [Hyphomicrobiaceae bacterium]